MTKNEVLIPAATHARTMGRVLRNDAGDAISFDWPAVRLTFDGVTGTKQIAIRMKGGNSVLGYRVTEEAQNHTAVATRQDKILNCYLQFRQRNYCVARQLDPNKAYQLQIWKRDDPGASVVRVVGLVLDAGGSCANRKESNESTDETDEVTTTTKQKRRRHIEFVGDSDTVGFGNMARKSGLLYSILCEVPLMMLGVPCLLKATDASRSYGACVAAKLDCDYSIIAKSGIGAQYSIDDDETMVGAYSRTLFSRPSSRMSAAAENEPQPDLIVVYIGNNDQASIGSGFRHRRGDRS